MTLPPFAVFLDEHRVDVYRFLTAMVGRAHADDCFQDTFLAALRAYPRLEPGVNLRAWIMTIAGRKAIDHGRRRGRSAIPVAELPEVTAPETPNGEPGLWRAVRALPAMQRAAIVHRYVLDRSYREIAEALGCSEEAARANAHEGRKRLRRELAAAGTREEDS
jgi:RNA polymerase sigma factor (sigma-70 family)